LGLQLKTRFCASPRCPAVGAVLANDPGADDDGGDDTRIVLFPVSAIYSAPAASTVMPSRPLNRATPPAPSALPEAWGWPASNSTAHVGVIVWIVLVLVLT